MVGAALHCSRASALTSAHHPPEPFPDRTGKVSLGASSPIRHVVSHRLQSAVTGRSSDERDRGAPVDSRHSPMLARSSRSTIDNLWWPVSIAV